MIVLATAAFLLPAVAMFALVRRLTTPTGRSPAWLLLQVALAAGLGLGLASCSFFAWRVAIGRPETAYVVTEMVLVIATFVAIRFAATQSGHVQAPLDLVSSRRPSAWLSLAFLAALSGALLVFTIQSRHQPDGEWDAWTNFNLRARVLYQLEGPKSALIDALNTWPVSDYPLLVPSLVARGWTYMGNDRPAIPVLVAFVFTFGTVVLMTASLALLRSPGQALLGGVLLLCTQLFPLMGATQYADVPLGFFMLAGLVLLTLHDRLFRGRNGVLVLAGCAAGLAAWTKNDGVLFALVLVVVRGAFTLGSESMTNWRRQMVALLGGLVPVFLVLIWFKVGIAVPSEFVAKQSLSETVARLMDLSKYPVIASIFVKEAIRFGPWAPFDLIPLLVFWLLFVGFDIPSGVRHTLVAPAVMLFLTTVGYAFACLISPYDLRWQLDTALFRLQTQLWPSTLWAALLVAHPWDAAQ